MLVRMYLSGRTTTPCPSPRALFALPNYIWGRRTIRVPWIPCQCGMPPSPFRFIRAPLGLFALILLIPQSVFVRLLSLLRPIPQSRSRHMVTRGPLVHSSLAKADVSTLQWLGFPKFVCRYYGRLTLFVRLARITFPHFAFANFSNSL